MSKKRTILFLASNPKDYSEIRATNEHTVLKKAFKSKKLKDAYHFEPEFNITSKKFLRHLRASEPWLVHFCGHGKRGQGLVLEGKKRQPNILNGKNIAEQINRTVNVKGVFLNACHSATLAEEFIGIVDFFIGIEGEVDDDVAIKFAKTFYKLFEDYESIWFAMKYVENDLATIKLKTGTFKPILRWNKSKSMAQASNDIQSILFQSERALRKLENKSNLIEDKLSDYMTSSGYNSLYIDLLKEHPYPQIPIWIYQERDYIILKLVEKCMEEENSKVKKRFGRSLRLLIDLLEMTIITYDYEKCTKEEIYEVLGNKFDSRLYVKALKLLQNFPKGLNKDSTSFLKDNCKYFIKIMS